MKVLWLLVCVLFLTGSGARAARKRRPASRLRRVFRALEWTAGIIAGGITLVATVYAAAGPFWPTPPDILLPADNGSSPVWLPFQLGSKNNFFPITRTDLTCYLDLLLIEDATKHTFAFRGMQFAGEPVFVPGSYNCGADFFRIKADGSAEIGFPNGQRLQWPPGSLTAPAKILKMCVLIGGTYESLDHIGQVPVAGYQWPQAPGVPGRVREPITFDIDQARWLPSDAALPSASGPQRTATDDGALRSTCAALHTAAAAQKALVAVDRQLTAAARAECIRTNS